MPTLFTVLSARHRPTAPPPPLTSAAPPRQPPKTLLETELPATVTATASRFVGRRRGATPRRRVIVVGAGFAGLCAAYELTGLGYDVEVYEARNRVGGRVHSLDKVVPNKVMEGGAELIGSNHRLWLRYRHHFGLKFSFTKQDSFARLHFAARTDQRFPRFRINLAGEKDLHLTGEMFTARGS